MKKVCLNCLYMFKRIYKECPQYVWMTMLSASLASVNALFNVMLLKMALNTVMGEEQIRKFWIFIVSQLCFVVIHLCINSIYELWVSPKCIRKLHISFYMELFEKVKEIELSQYDNPDFYNKYTRTLNNSSTQALALMGTFSSVISAVISIIGLSAIITSLEPVLICFSIGNVIFSCYLSVVSSKLAYELNKSQVQCEREMSYIRRVFYLRDYIGEIKTSNISDSLFEYFKKAGKRSIDIINGYRPKRTLLFCAQSVLQIIYNIGMMLYLVWKLIANLVSAGDFTALINASNRLSSSLKSLFNIYPKLYEHSMYIGEYRDFIEYVPYSVFNGENKKIDKFRSMKLEDVEFNYNTGKKVLNGINISLSAGEKIALVGPNGAGKSTIVKLLLGLYNATAGKIFYNGEDIANYSKDEIINKVGIVFQDFRMYSIPIIENILMRPVKNKTEDERLVNDALKKVGMLDRISRLKDGIYTCISKELDKDGVIFSGGELQRLAVARALAQNYEILILDEPSSSLDLIVEKQIFDIVFNQYMERTVIIVSHRLANLKSLDKIYYIDNGTVAESGTHEQLMALNGKYAEMYSAKLQ